MQDLPKETNIPFMKSVSLLMHKEDMNGQGQQKETLSIS